MNLPPAIRIILAEMPGLMGSVVRDAIKGQPDMGIVAEIAPNADVTDSVSNGRCDVVVAALSPGSTVPPAYQALLFADTPVPFIALDPDGRRFQAYGRSVRRQFAASELLTVIRRLANSDSDSDNADALAGGAGDPTKDRHVV